MSKEQIEEMAKAMCLDCAKDGPCSLARVGGMCNSVRQQAALLYNAGYRKQSEGEWIFEFTLDGDDFYKCSVCGRQEVVNGLCKEKNPLEHLPYCHCGAKMKGGAE